MVHKNLAGIREMPKLAAINYDKYDTDSILLEMAEKEKNMLLIIITNMVKILIRSH